MESKARLKWEPAALMALVLGLGLWIAFGPGRGPSFPIPDTSLRHPVQIGDTKGTLEAIPPTGPGGSDWTFRLWTRDERDAPPVLSRAEAERVLGHATVERCTSKRVWVFKWLNITSWGSLVWICVGFVGQLLFSGRMVIQWLVSEKSRRSVVSESFWWFSLAGGVTLFAYFVWRQDPVPLIGQASGIVIYARNIRLLRKHARRAARGERESSGI